VKKLVRVYPRRWKDRYGQEFERILSDYPTTTGTVCNVICGAVVAHLQEHVSERRNGMSTARRILSSTWFLIALAAIALIVYGGLVAWVALWRYDHLSFHYPATRWHTWRGEAVGMLGIAGTVALATLITRRYLSIRLTIARRPPTRGQSTQADSV
jgi:hypothetical protein